MTVPVSEIFPAWQGEGPHAGRRCSFLRLGLCNLHCEWCDTPFTWDITRFDVATECPLRTTEDILGTLATHGTDLLVLSGGEPLIHANSPALIGVIRAWGGVLDLETNGTLPPPAWSELISVAAVSPKIGQTADTEARRIRPDVLGQWSNIPGAVLKVVCRDSTDVDVLADMLPNWGDWNGRVWVMPEGVDGPDLLTRARDIEPTVAHHGFNLSLRAHTLMFGTERAR